MEKDAEIPFATGADIGRTVDFVAGRNRYIGHLISIATRSFKNYNASVWTVRKRKLLLPLPRACLMPWVLRPM